VSPYVLPMRPASEGQDKYLMIGLATEADSAGLRPGEAVVYNFWVPTALGGAVALENVEVSDFVVAANIAGRFISRFTCDPETVPATGSAA
jgi:hypothetical protein